MDHMASPLACTAGGRALGGAAVYVATQDQRQIRRTVRKAARGAEKTLSDLGRMVEQYTR